MTVIVSNRGAESWWGCSDSDSGLLIDSDSDSGSDTKYTSNCMHGMIQTEA